MTEDDKTQQPAPDPGNVEDPRTLTEPLDEDDDVHERIALVNQEHGIAPRDENAPLDRP